MAKFLVALLFLLLPSYGNTFDIKDFDMTAIRYGIGNLYLEVRDPKRQLTVAVLDDGFEGYKSEIKKTLPRNTKLIESPIESVGRGTHGLVVAQIFTAFATDKLLRADLEPKLYLIEVSGAEDMKHAVDQAMKVKADIIIHGQVYESDRFEANAINTQINKAAAAGVIWVNSAGNYGQTTYNSKLGNYTEDDFVALPLKNQAIRLTCNLNICSSRLSLIWLELTRPGDLDLILYNSKFEQLEVSNPAGRTLKTINKDLARGEYYLKVKRNSKGFSGNEPIRIVAGGSGLKFDKFHEGESMLTPAGNPNVITVGAMDTASSSQSMRMSKPDVLTPSRLITDAGPFLGTSSAAAIMAARMALLKEKKWSLDREGLIVQLGLTGAKINMPEQEFAQLAMKKGGIPIVAVAKSPPQTPPPSPTAAPEVAVAQVPQVETIPLPETPSVTQTELPPPPIVAAAPVVESESPSREVELPPPPAVAAVPKVIIPETPLDRPRFTVEEEELEAALKAEEDELKKSAVVAKTEPSKTIAPEKIRPTVKEKVNEPVVKVEPLKKPEVPVVVAKVEPPLKEIEKPRADEKIIPSEVVAKVPPTTNTKPVESRKIERPRRVAAVTPIYQPPYVHYSGIPENSLRPANFKLPRSPVYYKTLPQPPPVQRGSGSGIPLGELGMVPANGRCLRVIPVGRQQFYVADLINKGGQVIETNQGLQLMVPFDPILLFSQMDRTRSDDAVVTTPEGYRIIPRNEISRVPDYWIEVIQTPSDYPYCT